MAGRQGKRISLNPSRNEAMQALFSKELSLVKSIESVLVDHPPEPEEIRADFYKLSTSYRSLLAQVMKLTSISDATQLQLKHTKNELSVALGKVERLNKNLQTLNEEKDEILALAAHDLRSPLSGILGLADLIASGQTASESETKSYASDISTLADDTLEMIRNLLDIYRFDQVDGTSTQLWPVTLNELLVQIQDFSRANARRKNISVIASADYPECQVQIEIQLFLRVAENLVSNALKYSPSGKTIHIQLQAQKNHLLLTVRDEGPGISESDQEKLFTKFSRLSSRPTGGESSVGLGLAIVHRILSHLGGSIKCQSQLGKGATFIARFPTSITP